MFHSTRINASKLKQKSSIAIFKKSTTEWLKLNQKLDTTVSEACFLGNGLQVYHHKRVNWNFNNSKVDERKTFNSREIAKEKHIILHKFLGNLTTNKNLFF